MIGLLWTLLFVLFLQSGLAQPTIRHFDVGKQIAQEIDEPYMEVEVSKVDLYEQPYFASKSKGYIIEGDEFQVLDAVESNWLQISYKNPKRTITAWINCAELALDKYKLRYKGGVEGEGVNLNFLYPYDKGKFYFSLGLNNNSQNRFKSFNGRIYVLLENKAGRRYLYDLYEAGELDLPPKTIENTYGQNNDGRWYVPSAMLDDNLVEWGEELQKYLIYHNAGTAYYPEFVPTSIPDGAYTMYAVFYDPYSGLDPVVSNSQEVILPLPKVPISWVEEPEEIE